jgi:hypothetical protein
MPEKSGTIGAWARDAEAERSSAVEAMRTDLSM